MRTSKEIVDRITWIKSNMDQSLDIFGFEVGDLIPYLSFEDAKPYLKEEVTESEFAEIRSSMSAKERIIDYLNFAWGKANDCRGISALRSISHFKAWVWLDGNDALYEAIREFSDYYAKPSLVLVSECYDFPWEDHDNGCWQTGEDASSGITNEDRAKQVGELLIRADIIKTKHFEQLAGTRVLPDNVF